MQEIIHNEQEHEILVALLRLHITLDYLLYKMPIVII